MGFDDIMDALGEMADIADDLTNLPQVLKKSVPVPRKSQSPSRLASPNPRRARRRFRIASKNRKNIRPGKNR